MAEGSGRRIVYGSVLVAGLAAGYSLLLSPETRERLTTFEDSCGNFEPFYQSDGVSVASCAPLIDRTTQETVREAFTYVPEPGSTVVLDNGNYAVGVHLQYEPDIPSRLFGKSSLSLLELDETLQSGDETQRSYCVGDMSSVVDFIKERTAEYAINGVTAFELGSADNAYAVYPAGRGENPTETPDMFIYDAASTLPPAQALVTCWTP